MTYVDESGNTGLRLDDPAQPFHVLVGVSVHEESVNDVASHLDQVARHFLGTAERTKATEFHASELRGGNGPWKGIAPAGRIDAFSAALEPLLWDSVFVSHATIRKQGLLERGDTRSPHMWALQFLIEKLNGHLAPLQDRTLLVADQTNEHEQFALELLAGLQAGQPRPGLDLGPMNQVIDTVHFVRSETNRGVQLADLVAYLLNRLQRTGWPEGVELNLWTDCVADQRRTWREMWP